jgi:hypothetical protein
VQIEFRPATLAANPCWTLPCYQLDLLLLKTLFHQGAGFFSALFFSTVLLSVIARDDSELFSQLSYQFRKFDSTAVNAGSESNSLVSSAQIFALCSPLSTIKQKYVQPSVWIGNMLLALVSLLQ